MKQYPKARKQVNAHTDSKGSEFFNMNLSTRRAKIAFEGLGLKGVNTSNMVPRTFGELKPIATLTTRQMVGLVTVE